jgi:hypothetical protein
MSGLRGARRGGIFFGYASRTKIMVERAVSGVQNEMAVMAFAQVLFNLARY